MKTCCLFIKLLHQPSESSSLCLLYRHAVAGLVGQGVWGVGGHVHTPFIPCSHSLCMVHMCRLCNNCNLHDWKLQTRVGQHRLRRQTEGRAGQRESGSWGAGFLGCIKHEPANIAATHLQPISCRASWGILTSTTMTMAFLQLLGVLLCSIFVSAEVMPMADFDLQQVSWRLF